MNLEHASDYENNATFENCTSDIKPIALYLPQFHTFPENDRWWGKGFTEWTNVKKAQPRFDGHEQPRVPHEDLGYYDLSDVNILKQQARLAKEHGIYGFGIYYYWFSGKMLMEKPLNLLLEHHEIDLPFFLIWANENWTRTWDGKANNILIQQEYSKHDPEQFILDIKRFLDDERYIKIDGKPVIGLYNPAEVPDLEIVLQQWRETAQKEGIGDIYILTCASSSTAGYQHILHLIDGEYEFPPRLKGDVPSKHRSDDGISFDYRQLVEVERNLEPYTDRIDLFRGAMLNWDNSARKQYGYNCWDNFSFELFYYWLKEEIVYSRKFLDKDKRFLFINAWNEWGEGTYLEPDQAYGYKALNTLSRAIYDQPYKEQTTFTPDIPLILCSDFSSDESIKDLFQQPLVAVQAHVFYDELIDSVVDYVNSIPVPYDLYITTTSEQKKAVIQSYAAKHSTAQHIQIDITDNRGRDVISFMSQMEPVLNRYKYFCHIHTKKSKHLPDLGDIWRNYLYKNLLGSGDIVSKILGLFETNPKIGLIFPENIDLIQNSVEWGSNKPITTLLFNRLNISYDLPDDVMFPAGNMFWGRVSAVKELFATECYRDLVPEEEGQIDNTIMHAIERSWVCVADFNGYTYQTTRNIEDNRPLFGFQATNTSIIPDVGSAINNAAWTIGVINALKTVAFAFCILVCKVLPFTKPKEPLHNDPYDPYLLARTYGVKDSLTILRKTIGIFIYK